MRITMLKKLERRLDQLQRLEGEASHSKDQMEHDESQKTIADLH